MHLDEHRRLPTFETHEAKVETVLSDDGREFGGRPDQHRYELLSLERLEVDRIVDYRPLFLSGDQKPTHDAVRAWVRGFWKTMALAPETWSKLAEDERTRIIIAPFVGFFDLGHLAPYEVPVDIDDRLDEDAALIPRMILVPQARPYPRSRQPRRNKVGRNDPCPCGSGEKYKRCCGRT